MLTATPVKTVSELIAVLSELPGDMVPIGMQPPFNGVTVFPQDNGRQVLIATTRVPDVRADLRVVNDPVQ